MNQNPILGITWIFPLFGILGYFGVSDADVVLRNHPFGYSPSSQLNNNNNINHNNNNKLSEAEESIAGDERLLDQVVINALANPHEWAHLKQLFERVDDEISRTKIIPESVSSNLSSSSVVMDPYQEWLSSSSTMSRSSTNVEKILSSKRRFSYHRVEESRKGRPFAAVTLDDVTTSGPVLASGLSSGDHLEIEDKGVDSSWEMGHLKNHHHHRQKTRQNEHVVKGRHDHHQNHHHSHHHHVGNEGHHHTHRPSHHHHHNQH